jgi:hypothetical protein
MGLAGCLIAAGSLAIGVATSDATGHHIASSAAAAAPTKLKVKCKASMSVAVPAGQTVVLQGATKGTMYGSLKCSGGINGAVSFPFKVASSGDIVGNLTGFTGTGAVTGAVNLAETSSAAPTPYVFGNANLAGTFKIKSGQGTFKGVTGKGTLKCATSDSIHYTCTLKTTATLG